MPKNTTTKKKILLTGATGYVGGLILKNFHETWEITSISRKTTNITPSIACDLTDKKYVERLARLVKPDTIIHAAGNKNLAFCESNPHQAYAVNVETTLNLLAVFPDTPLIYISSDYVFPGDRGNYRETDPIAPQTVYGRTKACAELAGETLSHHFITLRLSALYDQQATFLGFLQQALSASKSVDCFTDAYYSPTYHTDFLNTLECLVEHPLGHRRIFHACGQRISRYFFARLYARAHGFDEALIRPASRVIENPPFLFADLSMENTLTRELLDLPISPHKDALINLAQQ